MSSGETGLDARSTAAATTLVMLLWAAAAPLWAAEGSQVDREVVADLHSQLSLPLEVDHFASGPRANLGEAADEFLRYRLEGEVEEERGGIGELATLVRSVTVGNKPECFSLF